MSLRPNCRAYCAMSKNGARGGFVDQLYPFAVGRKDSGMLASNVAATQGSKANVTAPSRSGMAITNPLRNGL